MLRRILQQGRNCFEDSGVDRTGICIDGAEYYTAFYHAAKKAHSYILISGWQFDSEVMLLRGKDAGQANGETRLLKFLDSLCARNPELKVYILAWDFSLIFMREREWMQELIFNWSTSERLSFRFDNRHAIGASQHQKYVVIDGAAAFLGGMDICAGRWDTRKHLPSDTDRINPDGVLYEPYHDIQAYFTGPLVKSLSEGFVKRWRDTTGSGIELPPPEMSEYLPHATGIPIAAHRAALSRTLGQTFVSAQYPVKEIRTLYIDAILAANRLIYIENQYFSSYAVYKALIERMEAQGRGLNIVLILPKKPNALVEEISMGLMQTRLLNSLKKAAQRTGHSLGVYYVTAFNETGDEVPVYIHSKMMIIDDRFLTVGSANTTNRSMGLDSELNISWEASSIRELRLMRSIRKFRVELLLEHTGYYKHVEAKRLSRAKGLVSYLDGLADLKLYRIQRHSISSYFEDSGWMKAIDDLVLDPEKAVVEENVFEIFSPDLNPVFTQGITSLKKWLSNRKKAG